MRRIIALSLATMLAGCGLGPEVQFGKPGGTQQEYTTANYECLRDVKMMHVEDPWSADQRYRDCMHAHGWYEQ